MNRPLPPLPRPPKNVLQPPKKQENSNYGWWTVLGALGVVTVAAVAYVVHTFAGHATRRSSKKRGNSQPPVEGPSCIPVWLSDLGEEWPGAAVVITGLKKKQELNGRRGVLVSYDEEADRYVVRLTHDNADSFKPHVKAGNLSPLAAAASVCPDEIVKAARGGSLTLLQIQRVLSLLQQWRDDDTHTADYAIVARAVLSHTWYSPTARGVPGYFHPGVPEGSELISTYNFGDQQLGHGYILCSTGEQMSVVIGHCGEPPGMQKVPASDQDCQLRCLHLFGREHRAYGGYASIRRTQIAALRAGGGASERQIAAQQYQEMIEMSGIGFISFDPANRAQEPHDCVVTRAQHFPLLHQLAQSIRLEEALEVAVSGTEPEWWPWIINACDFWCLLASGTSDAGSVPNLRSDEQGWPMLYTSLDYLEEGATKLVNTVATIRLAELRAAMEGGGGVCINAGVAHAAVSLRLEGREVRWEGAAQ